MNNRNLQVIYLPISELHGYERNSRTHSAKQISQICDSIQRFGFTNPILIDESKHIIAGHGRLEAAKKMEIEQVPTLTIDGLTELERKALVIADNRIALNAGWDDEMLALELNDLSASGFDMDVLGFTGGEIRALIGSGTNGGELTDEDDAPKYSSEQLCQSGDIWLLGDHRLMCGDSTSAESVQHLMNGHKADMLLTDPPYNVAYEGKTKDQLTIKNDAMSDGKFREFLKSAFAAADSVMKPVAVFYIWHADAEGFNFRGACQDVNWPVRQCLIWNKNSKVMGRQDYHWKHEPCLYGWKPGASHLWSSDRKQTTIIDFDRPQRNQEHPTMKPVGLFEYQMLNNTKGGDLIIDLFGGSGTTIIAAEKNGRRANLMELDPKYCDVIIKRWQAYSGKSAVHSVTGQPYPVKQAPN